MIAITTNNSIKVNPGEGWIGRFNSLHGSEIL
jgi:hypothetical protein